MNREFQKRLVIAAGFFLVQTAWPIGIQYDFSDRSQIQGWTLSNPDQSTLEYNDAFARTGTKSLHFQTPRYRPGMVSWPAIDVFDLPIKDWTPYNRFVVEITNASSIPVSLSMYLTDSKTPFRQGIRKAIRMDRCHCHQFVFDFTSQASKINLKNAYQIHFSLKEPSEDIHLYFDRLYLLKPNQPLPEIAPNIQRQTIRLLQNSPELQAGKQLVSRIERLLKNCSSQDDDAVWLRSFLKTGQQQLEQIQSYLDSEQPFDTQTHQDMTVKLKNLSRLKQRFDSIEALLNSYRHMLKASSSPAEKHWANTLVAQAPVMHKVLPKNMPLPKSVRTEQKIHIDLAQNEYESRQIVVLPLLNDLKNVTVKVLDLQAEDGTVFPAKGIQTQVIGFVKTSLPHYKMWDKGQYAGWWPDPLLSFMQTTDVAKEDAQPFLVTFKTQKDTPAKRYQGTVAVSASNIETPLTFDLSVNVYAFQLPVRSPLSLIMAFRPRQNMLLAQKAEPDYSEVMWQEKWNTLKYAWSDFLTEYYIHSDQLYQSPPDFEIIDYERQKGVFQQANIGFIGNGPRDANAFDAYLQEMIEKIRPAYEKAKARNMLDKSYIYGFDERPKAYFPMMDRVFTELKKEFPGIRAVTCAGAYWDYWGTGADSVDVWLPIIGQFKTEKAQRLRAQGKESWWYICTASPPPNPNVYVDKDPIDVRLLMGAMTAKYRPDGFLYFAINYFGNYHDHYIETGPYTTFSPKGNRDSAGNGRMVYVGPGGTPLSSLIMENFRDGLDDFAYYRILEETAKKVKSQANVTDSQLTWLKKVEKLLSVPAPLVSSITSYTKNPAVISGWRNQLAEAIVAVPGMTPVRLD